MIGAFLVFVATVCAVFRYWWDRLEDCMHETKMGELEKVGLRKDPDGGPWLLFAQYFLRGKEFWWWMPTVDVSGRQISEEEIKEAMSELMHQSLSKHRGHKVQSACLVTVGDDVDVRDKINVTKFLRQLSGPQGDYYRTLAQKSQPPPLDADAIRAYLACRLPMSCTDRLPEDWLYMTMCVVPGSVAPFKPLWFWLGGPE